MGFYPVLVSPLKIDYRNKLILKSNFPRFESCFVLFVHSGCRSQRTSLLLWVHRQLTSPHLWLCLLRFAKQQAEDKVRNILLSSPAAKWMTEALCVLRTSWYPCPFFNTGLNYHNNWVFNLWSILWSNLQKKLRLEPNRVFCCLTVCLLMRTLNWSAAINSFPKESSPDHSFVFLTYFSVNFSYEALAGVLLKVSFS